MSQNRQKSSKNLAASEDGSEVESEIDSLDSEAELKHIGEESILVNSSWSVII